MRKQKNSVKKPPKGAKKQERRAVNMSLLRWYAYLSPLRFFGYSAPIESTHIESKEVRSGKAGFL